VAGEKCLQIVEFDDDDPKPAEHRWGGAEENSPFVSFDVDLEQQILCLVRFCCRHPLIKRDGFGIRYGANELGYEIEPFVCELGRCDRCVGEVSSHPEFNALQFESGELSHAGGEAGGNAGEIVGE
jgi:hypothetical protein